MLRSFSNSRLGLKILPNRQLDRKEVLAKTPISPGGHPVSRRIKGGFSDENEQFARVLLCQRQMMGAQ